MPQQDTASTPTGATPTRDLADKLFMSRRRVDAYPSEVSDALLSRGWKADDRPSADTAFDEYCDWHGLINWGPDLRRILIELASEADS